MMRHGVLAATCAGGALLGAVITGTVCSRRASNDHHSSSTDVSGGDGGTEEYTPPHWAPAELPPPKQRLRLAHLPTPLHRWHGLPDVPEDVEVSPRARSHFRDAGCRQSTAWHIGIGSVTTGCTRPPLSCSGWVHGRQVWIKRDDCTGCELSGNKVRKVGPHQKSCTLQYVLGC